MACSRLLVVLAVSAACGDNDPPPSGRPQLHIAAPATAGIGAALPVHVQIDGPSTGGLSLYLVARGPGDGIPGDGARFVFTGSAPATGAPRWLGPGGWTDAETAYVTNPDTADLIVMLPSTDVGSWLLSAYLRDDDTIVAADAAAALVSDDPALALSIDRLWAMGDDPIHARLRIASGGRDVDVATWLTTPDGRDLALPSFGPHIEHVPYGDLMTLLARPLGVFGAGDYRIAARLVDHETGEYLAAAGAGFTVCATRGSLTGTVRDEAGNPLGADASYAVVQAFDADRAAHSAAIDAGGGYAFVDLAPGAYDVTATVVDAGGTHSTSTSLQVGCLATTTDLVAPRSSSVRGHRRSTTRVRPEDNPPTSSSVCNDTVSIYVEMTRSRVLTNLEAPLIESIAMTQLQQPGLKLIGASEVASKFGHDALSQAFGVDSPDQIQATAGALGTDFIMTIEPERLEGHYKFDIRVINARTGISMGYDVTTTFDDEPDEDELDGLFESFRDPGFVSDLAAHRPNRPVRVELVAWPPNPVKRTSITPGDRLQFTTVPIDRVSCTGIGAGKTVTLVADHDLGLVADHVDTDTTGLAHHYQKADSDDIDVVTVHSELALSDHVESSDPITIEFQAPGGVQFDPLSRARLPFHFATRAVVTTATRMFTGSDPHTHLPKFELIPKPNTTVTLDADEDTVWTKHVRANLVGANTIQVVTDNDGRAEVEFTTGDIPGLAHITAYLSGDDEPAGRTTFVVEPPLVVHLSSEPSREVLAGKPLGLIAYVDLPNKKPGVGLDVTFEVISGGGTITKAVGKTDATGRASTLFTAPTTTGAVKLRASATLDGVTAHGDLDVTVRPPCTGCPVDITSEANVVLKGDTLHFYANQIVTWSASGGAMDAQSGAFVAGQQGGEWVASATSLENPGTTGQKSFIIKPSGSEYVAHAPYTVVQDLVLGPGTTCLTSGTGIATIEVLAKGPPATADQVDVIYRVSPTCYIPYGVGDFSFPPTVRSSGAITQSGSDNISGCPLYSINVAPKGPGLAGVRGSIFLGTATFDSGTGTWTCIDQVSGTFSSP